MKNKGFTLIELMIVIAISAILLSIIFQAISDDDGNNQYEESGYDTSYDQPSDSRFDTGECVTHKLDEDREGIVVTRLSDNPEQYKVRFEISDNAIEYYADELEEC